MDLAEGFVPAVSLAAMAEPTAAAVEQRTVFESTAMLTPSEFGLLTFLELQAIKAAGEIIAVPSDHSVPPGDTPPGTDA